MLIGEGTSAARSFGLVLLLVAITIGCGSQPDPSRPVYDTEANPTHFPQAACLLLDRIEGRGLIGLDSIAAAFADLYSQHPDLLDNRAWHEIIDRLGGKLRHFGHQEAELGITHYALAGEYFELAAFARPDDPELDRLRGVFAAWRDAIADSLVDTIWLPQVAGVNAWPERVELVKRFYFGDSVQQRFARQYLVPQLLGGLRDDPAAESPARRLSLVDRAFLSALGLLNSEFDRPVVRFADAGLELAAYDVAAQPDGRYRAEFYFLPQRQPTADYRVALWIETQDSTLSESPTVTGYFTADRVPDPPTSRWQAGKIAAVGWAFAFYGSVNTIEVGLYTGKGRQTRFATITGRSDSLITLPVPSPSP